MRASLAVLFAALTSCTVLFEPEQAPSGGCPAADVIAHYDFESALSTGVVQDVSGNGHAGEVSGDTLQDTAGPMGLGQAGLFSGNHVVVIPPSPDFEVRSGSVSLWGRMDTEESEQGFISRDAVGTDLPGHFNLRTDLFDQERRVGLRIQPGSGEYSACAMESVPTGKWTHYIANFGPRGASLYVDGVLQMSCGGESVSGIDGNQNPWVIGADTGDSDEGSARPINGGQYLVGAVDEVILCGRRIEP